MKGDMKRIHTGYHVIKSPNQIKFRQLYGFFNQPQKITEEAFKVSVVFQFQFTYQTLYQ